MEIWSIYGEATKAALGFFWKSGWAFVLGYTISAMIQAFVPKKKMTQKMGSANLKSVSVATIFGSISSSCSFAALAAARSLLSKGAHFISAVAFMFASTNLVIELGILIYIFFGLAVSRSRAGWWSHTHRHQFHSHSVDLSRQLDRRSAKKAEQETHDESDDFDWKGRIASLSGWARVGEGFVMEWKMVWQEILVGFTLAGFIAVFVPESFWKTIFLAEHTTANPTDFWLVLENAMVAPFVAAATFIGSMGNIPLATILASSGVLFAGIMGFIYSDLMVPPLVKVNAKYYGWRVALYIAAIMYASIVCTAILLHYAFLWFGIMPESTREAREVVQFAIDYTFWLNLVAIASTAVLLRLNRKRKAFAKGSGSGHEHGESGKSLQDYVTYFAMAVLALGCIAWATA